jgi:hypothetical protein
MKSRSFDGKGSPAGCKDAVRRAATIMLKPVLAHHVFNQRRETALKSLPILVVIAGLCSFSLGGCLLAAAGAGAGAGYVAGDNSKNHPAQTTVVAPPAAPSSANSTPGTAQ